MIILNDRQACNLTHKLRRQFISIAGEASTFAEVCCTIMSL
jgi:hypothetical protein